jgi:hypothetical protein
MGMKRSPEQTDTRPTNYVGPSMTPTLRPGDQLQFDFDDQQQIRRGDVIIFVPPGGDSKIVHRVTSVNLNDIRTRGDNCNHEDDWVLGQDNILGRVVSAQRGKRRIRVLGGPLGYSFAMAIRTIKKIESILSSLLRPFYQRLARAGVFRRWLPTCMKTRSISLSHLAGTELQLLMGKRVIGRWLPGNKGWHIRRPFRLFVDETSLPENMAKGAVVPSEADPLSVVDEELLPNKIQNHLKSLPLDGGG